MIDERELREMLERRAATISATPTDVPKAIRRARRRLTVNAAVGTFVGLAVLLGAVAGVRTIEAAPTPADPPKPTPMPAALGALAYALDGDIYVADWDGANAVRIANGRSAADCGGLDEYFGFGQIWSPDGRYLAYRHANCQASKDEGWDVVISDAEGNVVATFPSDGWRISWSPDSTRVAVWVRWGETIGVYGLDGARQTQLTVPPGWSRNGEHDPVWMPDGTSLMLPKLGLPLDGGTPLPLPASAWSTTYSPDGSHVAYVDHRSLIVARSDGSEPREVFGDRADDPTWSPTGDRIAFTSGNGTELRVVDVATGTVTSLAEMDGSDILSVLDFSPDGDRILFSRTEDQGTGANSLWSVNVDGSNLRRLVAGTDWGDWLSPNQTP